MDGRGTQIAIKDLAKVPIFDLLLNTVKFRLPLLIGCLVITTVVGVLVYLSQHYMKHSYSSL